MGTVGQCQLREVQSKRAGASQESEEGS